MDTDENAPPSKDEKTTPAGMLSPFGFLAGVRAMLSPATKDPLSEAPIVTGRPALRDANASASPNQKSYMTSGLGGGGQVPAEATGDALLSPDKSGWQERGDRTSVASENSFVSALSSGNTSLPDGLQLASPGRHYGVESDTDTSTAYESAGETEGNTSVYDEAPRSSEGLLLNHPIAVSSPFETNRFNETFEKGAEAVLNETVQLEDSAGTGGDPLSVSFLVDHLGSLSLSTPLKTKHDDSSSGKGHITLDTDISGDLNSSHEQDSISISEADAKEALDSTITLAEEVENDVQVIPQQDSCTSVEPNLPEECPKTQDLNLTVDIASDSSSSNLSVVEVAQADADSEITAAALKELEGLGESSLNYSSLNQSDLSAYEAYLLDRVVNESGPHPDVDGSQCSQSECEEAVPLNETVVEVATSPSGTRDEKIPVAHELPEEICQSNSPTPDTHSSQEIPQPEKSPEVENVTSDQKLDEPSEALSSSLVVEPIQGEAEVVTSGEQVSDVSVNLSAEDQCQSPSEVAPGNANSLEDAPLPVKVPRTFEEILEEQLLAAGQTGDLSSADPNKVYTAATSTFDEAPLPTRKQRTFEEILAEELAAQGGDPEVEAPLKQAEPESAPVAETSGSPSAESSACSSSENLPETQSLEESVSGKTVETAESSPEESIHTETLAPSESDEIAIPIKPARTFEEILEAQLAAQGDPENAVPSFSTEEAPIPIKPPRTFEEILAAELAAQTDPENAVPSFSSPRKLNESYAKLISSESSFIEAESEPILGSDIAHSELETECNSGLELLIEKCKLQEQDLQLGESELRDLADEAGRLSLSCLGESQRASSVESEESLASDFANQTVIRAELESSPETKSPRGEIQVPPPGSQVKVSPGNIDEEQFTNGEDVFVDPSGFDFLSQRGGPCISRDFRKESLYVKFDPLVGSLSDSFSIMHPENSSDSQSGQTALADGAQQSSETQLTASEKLVSLSPSSSKQATAPTTPSRGVVKSTPVKTPAHVMLNETLESIGSRGASVKQEDLIKKLQEHQSVLEEQDKAYQERIAELEQRLQEMDLQSHQGDNGLQQQLQEKERQLQEKERQFQEKAQSLVELNLIMKEYEKTISRLVAEKSQEKASFDEKQVDLVKERDQAQQHLNNMEIAFSDIHTKYERLKSIVEVFKKNEETLNTALSEKQANFDKMQSMYDMLKSHAVSKLEKANQDLEGIRQKHQQENAKLKAMIKKLEIKTKSLEDTLEQKVKENQALTAICDELINKVGE